MTRPSLADITQRAEARAAYEGLSDAEYDPDVATDLACASAADAPALSAAIRDVLALHRPETWRGTGVLVCAHCRPAWTGSNRATYPCETVRAITAHIDTTPKETP